MQTKALLAGAALAAFYAISTCPAPMVAWPIITGIAAPLAGNLLAIGLQPVWPSKRDGMQNLVVREQWPGVSDEAIEQCRVSNEGREVTAKETGPRSARFENVSPECMNLAGIFTESGRPTPCGSACLDYTDLSDNDWKTLVNEIVAPIRRE